jgi:hypothetical protein
MYRIIKIIAISLWTAFLLFAYSDAEAQSKKWRQECADPQNCPTQQMQDSKEEDKQRWKSDGAEATGQQSEESSRKRTLQYEGSQTSQEPAKPPRNTTQAEEDWKFDARRHERRRKKDDRFRFEFGGYWYPEPYWWYDFDNLRPYRITCGEGRELLLDRGFRRVRTVECQGRIYTYLARRRGETFRIQVNSRSGRILNIRPV